MSHQKMINNGLVECANCHVQYSISDSHSCPTCGCLGSITVAAQERLEELKEMVKSNNPWDTQVGGGHYKKYAIQPTEYCQKNKLNACESNIIKYATRHQDKGKAQDVRKIIHYAKLLLQVEYGEVYEDDELRDT